MGERAEALKAGGANMTESRGMTRRRALELLGWGGAGCALYGVSWTKLLDFLYEEDDEFDGFTVMRRPDFSGTGPAKCPPIHVFQLSRSHSRLYYAKRRPLST